PQDDSNRMTDPKHQEAQMASSRWLHSLPFALIVAAACNQKTDPGAQSVSAALTTPNLDAAPHPTLACNEASDCGTDSCCRDGHCLPIPPGVPADFMCPTHRDAGMHRRPDSRFRLCQAESDCGDGECCFYDFCVSLPPGSYLKCPGPLNRDGGRPDVSFV